MLETLLMGSAAASSEPTIRPLNRQHPTLPARARLRPYYATIDFQLMLFSGFGNRGNTKQSKRVADSRALLCQCLGASFRLAWRISGSDVVS